MGARARDTRRLALARHSHLAAALCFALLVLAYLWPVLLGGEMLAPLSSLYGHVPWVGRQPADVAHYLNPQLSDVPLADYPWRWLARELLRAGTFPAWNPHVLAGIPFFANPQTMLLSPFSVPLWVLPLTYGVGVTAALTLWAAAFGTYLLVRELRLGFLPGLLAGTAYAFCSFHVMWLTHGTLPAVSALLPWMLWLVERVLRRRGPGDAIGLSFATATAITGGHPGTQVHVLAATGLYAVVRTLVLPDVAPAARGRRLALVFGAVATGMLLVAVLLVPELRTARGTLATDPQLGNVGLGHTDMPLGAIRTVLFPDWWGRPSAHQTFGPTFQVPGGRVEATYNERTFYPGVVALLLAVAALVSRGAWRAKAPFALVGVLALAISLHAPWLYPLVEHLPGLELTPNERMHFIFELAVAVLGAFGLDAVLARRRSERRQLAGPAAGVGVALAALLALRPGASDVRQVLHHFLTGADVRSDAALALTSIGWLLLLAGVLGALLVGARRWPGRATTLCAAIVVLAAADTLHFAHGYQPMAPAAKMIPPRTPVIAYLQRRVGDARIMGMGGALPSDWSLTYGFDDVRGYDPPYPTLRLYRLWRTANPQQGNSEPLWMATVDKPALDVLSVLRARYVIVGPGVTAVPSSDVGVAGLHRVYAGRDATVFVNDNVPPRVLVPPSLTIVEDEEGARDALTEERLDPRRTAVVERSEPGVTALAHGPLAHGSAAVTAEQNARVELRARLDRRGLVVLNDALIAGWSVQVDGRPAPAVRVNDVMRGVVVPAGSHRIVWRYAVPGLRSGELLSVLALVVLLTGSGWLVMGRRRAGLR